jgi:hypothetical protein
MNIALTTKISAVISILAAATIISSASAEETNNPSATATCRKSIGIGTEIVEGQHVPQYIASVKVQIRGEDAEKVYALGDIAAEPIEVDGRKIVAEPPKFKIKGFSCLNRWSSTSYHPKDGIGINLEFPGIPENGKLIDTVRGTVQVLAGGSEHVVSIHDLSNRKPGPIESPVLKTAKLKVDFDRLVTRFDDEAYVCIKLDMDGKNAFAGLQLVGADGKVSNHTPQIVQIGNTYECAYMINKADLGKASFRILLRDGGEVKSLPFEVHNVNIE